jgi:peptidoglycan/xylan/chitin deacetylase (PgdA/CDA1 family)
MRPILLQLLAFAAAVLAASAQPAWAAPAWGVEVHNRIAVPAVPVAAAVAPPGSAKQANAEQASTAQSQAVALTLDACSGGFDADLIKLLVAQRVPASIFVTKKWLDQNPVGTAKLLAHPDLFELQDHGTEHIPAVIGRGKRVYGMAGQPDVAHLQAEVSGAAQAIEKLTGRAPRYFRGATAVYDTQSLQVISRMGYQVAGFSVNADAGATRTQAAIVASLHAVQAGDVIIAHMNKPAGATAEAFAVALPTLLARGFWFVKLSQARLLPA